MEYEMDSGVFCEEKLIETTFEALNLSRQSLRPFYAVVIKIVTDDFRL